MASSRNGSPSRRSRSDDDNSVISTRRIEAFSRTVSATASHLIAPLGSGDVSQHYQNAIGELRRPAIQRGLWNFAQTTPRDLVRGRISVPEIQQRALAHVPDELLVNVPEDKNAYTLFQGFQASIPEEGIEYGRRRRFGRRGQNQRLIGDGANEEETGPPALKDLKKERSGLNHRLEMLEVRKNMCSTEIYEIDSKIANMNTMRKIVLDRLANLEQEEAELEHELLDIDNRLEDLEEELEDEAALAQKSPTTQDGESGAERGATGDFMSESIYEKIPTTKGPKPPRRKKARRVSHPVLHEHLEPGSKLRELQAHNDMVTAIDFDIPFGTAVTAALDDTVRVWDLSAGRCMGLLEGHLSSVRCLQVEDNIVATGSMDASIRLWDLSKAEYSPMDRGYGDDEEDGLAFENSNDAPPPPPENSMSQCPLFTLEAHVAEITALHFRNDTLVSGSADKTLRQWDLVKGRCVQTLDVLWAAAQASATMGSNDGQWRQTGRLPDASADFVGALQVFDAALACGTADGMVRLWDLRSGQVHRSLVGHTGPVTALQFDDVHLVTGSMDRSVRIWDLRTGHIHDAFAYDSAISAMRFDSRRIATAAGEDVVKIYDKTDGRHWDCGAGAIENPDFEGRLSVVQRVALKDGFLIEGRKDGMVGIWSC